MTTIKEAKKKINHHSGQPLAYKNPYLMGYRLAEYIENCRDSERPLTETGLVVALGIDRMTYYKYAEGENDAYTMSEARCREKDSDVKILIDKYRQDERLKATYRYITDNERKGVKMSEVIARARLLVSLEREETLTAKGRVGDIFIQKSREGWVDQPERVEHVLEIKPANIKAALEDLGYTQIEGDK